MVEEQRLFNKCCTAKFTNQNVALGNRSLGQRARLARIVIYFSGNGIKGFCTRVLHR